MVVAVYFFRDVLTDMVGMCAWRFLGITNFLLLFLFR